MHVVVRRDVYAYNRLLEKWPPERGWQVVSVADASLELVVLPETFVSSVAGADAGAGDDNARAKPLPGGSVTLPQETCASHFHRAPGVRRRQMGSRGQPKMLCTGRRQSCLLCRPPRDPTHGLVE